MRRDTRSVVYGSHTVRVRAKRVYIVHVGILQVYPQRYRFRVQGLGSR